MTLSELYAICWDGSALDLTRLDAYERRRQSASADHDEYIDEMSVGGPEYKEPGR